MKFNKIPNTDLNVSQICLGTMTWGSMQNTEQDGFEQMDYAVSKGINFLIPLNCIQYRLQKRHAAQQVELLQIG
jgi:predicted aldo/keto reductase-like oxidoreductase